jgi:hypothetical protein
VGKVSNGFVLQVRDEVYRKFEGLGDRALPICQSSREEADDMGVD